MTKEIKIKHRIKREKKEMLESLKDDIRLLREYSTRAFNSDDAFLGEVAGKLRRLVYEGGRNAPLLLRLMDEFGVDIPIILGGPPVKMPEGQPSPGDKISLRAYLNLTAYGIQTQSRGYVELSKKQLISIWAGQKGAAHADWDLDEEFALGQDLNLFIGGLQASAQELKITTDVVLSIADRFLATINDAQQ